MAVDLAAVAHDAGVRGRRGGPRRGDRPPRPEAREPVSDAHHRRLAEDEGARLRRVQVGHASPTTRGSSSRERSAMLGSPLYMAPEQMRSSRDVDARGDVWALGVVLFELLTGRSPFEAETMPELCLKIVSEPPLSLAQLRPDLPADARRDRRAMPREGPKTSATTAPRSWRRRSRLVRAASLERVLGGIHRSGVQRRRAPLLSSPPRRPSPAFRRAAAGSRPFRPPGAPRIAASRSKPPARAAGGGNVGAVASLAIGAAVVAFEVGRPGGTRAPRRRRPLRRRSPLRPSPRSRPSTRSCRRSPRPCYRPRYRPRCRPRPGRRGDRGSGRRVQPDGRASGAAKTTGSAAPASPAPRVGPASSVPAAVAKPDDDIPSLR